MFVLANEIEKVSAYARYNGKVVISEDMIYAVCSPSTVYGAFDFANAIIDSNTALRSVFSAK